MLTACFILLVNCLLCLVFNQMLKSQGKLQQTTKPLFGWRIKIQRIHSKVQNLPELQRHILRQVEQTESLVIPCSAWQTAPYNNVVIKLTCAVIIRPYCPSSATAHASEILKYHSKHKTRNHKIKQRPRQKKIWTSQEIHHRNEYLNHPLTILNKKKPLN